MKKIIFSIFLLLGFSLRLSASERQYVACASDPHEYNVLFEIESGRIFNYSINDQVWIDGFEVTAEEHEISPLWIEWASMNDTVFGYTVYLDKDLLNNWKVKSWTAGNDSDNYHAVENDDPVLCHLLKSRPKTPAIKANNVLKLLQDFQ